MIDVKKEDIIYTGCVVAVKSVMIAGAYLHRVRAWSKDGTMLVAIRLWSDRPYTRGEFLRLLPDTPYPVAKALEAARREHEPVLGAPTAPAE